MLIASLIYLGKNELKKPTRKTNNNKNQQQQKKQPSNITF